MSIPAKINSQTFFEIKSSQFTVKMQWYYCKDPSAVHTTEDLWVRMGNMLNTSSLYLHKMELDVQDQGSKWTDCVEAIEGQQCVKTGCWQPRICRACHCSSESMKCAQSWTTYQPSTLSRTYWGVGCVCEQNWTALEQGYLIVLAACRFVPPVSWRGAWMPLWGTSGSLSQHNCMKRPVSIRCSAGVVCYISFLHYTWRRCLDKAINLR